MEKIKQRRKKAYLVLQSLQTSFNYLLLLKEHFKPPLASVISIKKATAVKTDWAPPSCWAFTYAPRTPHYWLLSKILWQRHLWSLIYRWGPQTSSLLFLEVKMLAQMKSRLKAKLADPLQESNGHMCCHSLLVHFPLPCKGMTGS